MNIAAFFSAYKLLEQRIAALEADKAQLTKERDEWANKLLAKVNVAPLFYEPPKVEDSPERPPIGPTEKRAMLLKKVPPDISTHSDEEILEAARRANAAEANGGSRAIHK